MDRNSGICQKLINFILLKLRPQHALPSSARPADDPEIVVDYRHTDYKLQNGSDRNGLRANKGPKKAVTVEGSDHEEILVRDPDDHGTKARPRQHWPLRSVATNIDKKSDEFIESRKRAMSRNYSLDPEKS